MYIYKYTKMRASFLCAHAIFGRCMTRLSVASPLVKSGHVLQEEEYYLHSSLEKLLLLLS